MEEAPRSSSVASGRSFVIGEDGEASGSEHSANISNVAPEGVVVVSNLRVALVKTVNLVL